MMYALRDVAAQRNVRVRFMCVPDEESDEVDDRSTDALVRAGLGGDFAITGEPTDLHIGVQAKGVLAFRIVVGGRAAHGSTPWLGARCSTSSRHTRTARPGAWNPATTGSPMAPRARPFRSRWRSKGAIISVRKRGERPNPVRLLKSCATSRVMSVRAVK